MVPGDAILGGTPSIYVFLARRHWALSHTGNAVLPCSVELSDPMPMDGSAIMVTQIIDDGDVQQVSPISVDEWTRISPIDEHARDIVPIRSNILISEYQSILDR